MLIDINMLTGKAFDKLSEFSTPAERDFLLLCDKEVGEEIDPSSDDSCM